MVGRGAPVNKSQILIVEDDAGVSDMLSTFFRTQQYQVLTAAWGQEALRISQEQHVDLVVLDIRLPDIDGFEVCRNLRLQRRTQNVPIIFLTEKRDRVDKLQGLELGVVDYITKPFDIQELKLRVRNAITRASRQNLINAVTDLPETPMVDERLERLVLSDEKWAVLLLAINDLSQFRELYGFVAADDVLRAFTLMVKNAVREFGGAADFVGHLSDDTFVVITDSEHVQRIRERLSARVEQSREYFYPLRDPEKAQQAMKENQLTLSSDVLDSTMGRFSSLEAFKTALTDRLKALGSL
jgi:DNA-binding response OmpR family regulator